MRRCRVAPSISDRTKRRPSLADAVNRMQQVEARPCEPVKPRHNHHIALVNDVEQPQQLWTVYARPRLLFGKDFVAPAPRAHLAELTLRGHRADAEFAFDLLHVDSLALVGEARITGD